MKYVSTLKSDLRIDWLYRFRIFGFCIIVAIFLAAKYFLKLSLNTTPFFVICLSLVILHFALPQLARRINLTTEVFLGSLLLLDCAVIFALLYFYGGHTNPFCITFLIPLMFAAQFLTTPWVVSIFCCSVVAYVLLFSSYYPVHELDVHHMHGGNGQFSLHLQGMLAAFVLLAVHIAYSFRKMKLAVEIATQKLHQRSAQEQRLSSLATLAAGAAHELATPLATITIAAEDLSQRQPSADTELIQLELERCKKILAKMSNSAGEIAGEMPVEVTLARIVERLRQEYPPAVRSRLQLDCVECEQSVTIPLEGFLQSIKNIINNAIEASPGNAAINIKITADDRKLIVSVQDRGEGIAELNLPRIGEPFFTTKSAGRGMGLGVFISKTFIRSLDGEIEYDSTVDQGTLVKIEIPRKVVWTQMKNYI
ncbi:HAMP domain-containing histidine kinase [bacterium]|nr:HAMP domain-containing histidine kinase [bacterium]